MQTFRESAAWCNHLYAFAAPNEAALAALGKLAPLIEVGAGVGYWAHLLQARGIDVLATDIKPTACSGDSEMNMYHGRIPAWTEVQQGDATCCASHRCGALRLVCKGAHIDSWLCTMSYCNCLRMDAGFT